MSNTDEKKTDEVDVKNSKDETPKQTSSSADDSRLKENQSQVNEAVKESNGEKDEADKTAAEDASVNETMEDSVLSEAGHVGDNEDETEEEEDLPPGLLEKPIEVVGKRERKKTTRFIPDAQQSTDPAKKELKVPDGKGIELSKHPRVVAQLSKNKVNDLQLIHKLLFGAKAHKKSLKFIRTNILKFKGFDFAKDTPAFEKKEEEVGRFTVANLKWVMEVCDVCEHISALKSKDDLVDTFMDWSLNPQPLKKAAPSSKKKPAVKRKQTPSGGGDGGTTTDSATPVKVARKKTTKPKAERKKNKKSDDGSEEAQSEEDEDSAQAPTNAQIKKFIEKILKGANLEELTMKSVFVQVYAKYPLHDLSDRKPFIKETVKKLIS